MSAAAAAFAALFSSVFSTGPTALPEIPPGTLEVPPVLMWQVNLPGLPAATATNTEPAGPVVAGDHLYLGYSGINGVLVLDRRSGTKVGELPGKGPVRAAPLVAGERIYVSDAAGYMSCFDLSSRAEVWSRYTGAPVLSTPTLRDGKLYVSNVEDQVYALDAATGELLWRYAHRLDVARRADLSLYGAPAVVLEGDLALAGFSDGFLVGLGASDGSLRWSVGAGEGAYPDLIAPALVVRGAAVVGGYSEPLVHLDLDTRAGQWRLPIGSAAPMVADGDVVWHAGTDGILRKIDSRTGEVSWTWDSGTGGTLTEVTLTPLGVLLGSSEGSLYIVDPSDGHLKWHFDPGYSLNGFTAPPVVEGDMIYAVSNAGKLYAFRGRTPPAVEAPPPWVR